LETEKKEIFIVLTNTGTLLSSIIRVVKKAEYGHASISLDKGLNQLYSFGRLHPYNAFCGRFVREGIHFGTFKRFKDTDCKIYKLLVENSQYQAMVARITEMTKQKKKYKFNIQGLFLAAFNFRTNRRYRFYCSEFVKHILEAGNVDISNLPKVVQPDHLQQIKGASIIYQGLLRDYPA